MKEVKQTKILDNGDKVEIVHDGILRWLEYNGWGLALKTESQGDFTINRNSIELRDSEGNYTGDISLSAIQGIIRFRKEEVTK